MYMIALYLALSIARPCETFDRPPVPTVPTDDCWSEAILRFPAWDWHGCGGGWACACKGDDCYCGGPGPVTVCR